MSTVALLPNTDLQVEAAPKPVQVLCLRAPRPLDTVYFSKVTKRPLWATITSGPVTNLLEITDWGALLVRATISWAEVPGTGTKNSSFEPTVTIDGQTDSAERFGRHSTRSRHDKSIFTFRMDELDCRWKSAVKPVADQSSRNPMVGEIGWQHELQNVPHWECTIRSDLTESPALPPPSEEPTPSSSTSRFKSLFKSSPKEKEQEEKRTLLAIYQPPMVGVRSDMAVSIYPEGAPYTFQLLLSSILILSKKDEWKRSQSKRDAQQLEAIIKEDLVQRLPGYASRLTLHDTVAATTPSRW